MAWEKLNLRGTYARDANINGWQEIKKNLGCVPNVKAHIGTRPAHDQSLS